MNTRYDPAKLEAHWRKHWAENGLYKFDPQGPGTPFYWLTMLPYPSGDLHIGHWYAMAPSDAGARFRRMNGDNVFFPIGFDAFGLPAENAAIQRNVHPHAWTYGNIERMREQLCSMGAMWAWEHEIVSCEAEYYKWSQWIFLKFYEQGLAYREHAPVDFCPRCNTTLAREQVVGEEALCERCESPVERRSLNQWKFRITRYADALLDFREIEWPETVRTMQTNWIGRSEGLRFRMAVENQPDAQLDVFTTRPDTIQGITFCVLAPEHPLVEQITTKEQRAAVLAYCARSSQRSERQRIAETGEREGVFTGAFARHPLYEESVPIWIADYVLASYGGGAIMAVPAHDERDFDFARRYNLPIRYVVGPLRGSLEEASGGGSRAYTSREGSQIIAAGEFLHLPWPKSAARVSEEIETRGLGKRHVAYRLRDWLISRQRMWGTPIPMLYCERCGVLPVPYEDLPVLLPQDARFLPTGESPLKYHKGFLHARCPRCEGPATRETDTMDTFICSSWYMYAYLSPYWKRGERIRSQDTPWDVERIKRWLPIHQYTGGIEHAILHLMYLRFFAHALADLGVLPFREPVRRLFNQGMILGEDNEKMSKSRGNVVSPDTLVQRYGADVVRLYLMFIGPWEQGGPWNSQGIAGVQRFLQDVWRLCATEATAKVATGDFAASPAPEEAEPAPAAAATELALRRETHRTLRKVNADYQAFKYNTLVAALMHLRNRMKAAATELRDTLAWREATELLLLMLAPIAPFLSEELWQQRHPGVSVHLQTWPKYVASLAEEEAGPLVVQVDGRVRARCACSAALSREELSTLALDQPRVREALRGRQVIRVIPVGDRLINIVSAVA